VEFDFITAVNVLIVVFLGPGAVLVVTIVSEESIVSIFGVQAHFNPEDGEDTLQRSVGNHVQDHTVSQLVKPQSTRVQWSGRICAFPIRYK
jgi:hypothetical protein